MPVQKFRARLKKDKYCPEDDPEFNSEFTEYFAKSSEFHDNEYQYGTGEANALFS